MNIKSVLNNQGMETMDYLTSKFEGAIERTSSTMDEMLRTIEDKDSTNPALLAKLQNVTAKFSLVNNAGSNVNKVFKDVNSSIISNFR